MTEKLPRTVTFQIGDQPSEQLLLYGPFPAWSKEKMIGLVNNGCWGLLAEYSLKPDLLVDRLRPSVKPFNRRQRIFRAIRRRKERFYQSIHDWAADKGGNCRDSW